jgi:uncharacterized protein YxeA
MKKLLILLLTYLTMMVSFTSVLLLGSNIYDCQSFWVQVLKKGLLQVKRQQDDYSEEEVIAFAQ